MAFDGTGSIVAAPRQGTDMEDTLGESGQRSLAPVESGERIHALDVVRGVALVGIFLMNVEFFNRPIADLGEGLPSTLTGIHALAGWLVYSFVQGKFWTMFSLLFGMGFAVMLTRAERAGRAFLAPYLRRIAALAVFGALHYILIWSGDILFSYAVAATGLLIVIYGRPRAIAAAFVALIGIGFIPGFSPAFQVAGGLAFMGIAAFFLRSEAVGVVRGRDVPLFSIFCGVIAAVVSVAAIAVWLIPSAAAGRGPMTIIAPALWLVAGLSARFHDPKSQRMRSLGVGLYLFPFLMMTAFGGAQWLSKPAPTPVANEAIVASASPPAATPTKSDAKPAAENDEKADGSTDATDQAPPTAAEKAAQAKADRVERERAQAAKSREETRVMTKGSYLDAVRLRATEFVHHVPGEANFAILVVGMFLLGAWFVRSGIMENPSAHLPLFRKLAWIGIPLGCGLGLIGGAIATGAAPGQAPGQYQTALGLAMLGNLPACLGYVGLIVLMLHSRGRFRHVRIVAPAGRMALTNYLTQSVLGTLFFYGYGLGHWGLGRAWQVVFVFVVFGAQVAFCHWWLARFRFGPMEWLWRAITYWQWPPMRRTTAVA